MKMLAALAVLGAALSSAAGATPAEQKASRLMVTLPTDWNAQVTVTPDGGFLVGNPAAKAKFVEYGSLTCPYCQRFYAEATAPLRTRIASGQVSFEFRPFGVHDADPILHALLLCAGPASFNRFADDFYADQEQLAAPFWRWAEADPSVNAIADAATRIRLSADWGFTRFALAHGLTEASVTACLSDQQALTAQQDREERAYRDRHVEGTPTFFLNGQPLDAGSWADVDRAISAVLN